MNLPPLRLPRLGQREKTLILELLTPRRGERLLAVGFDDGDRAMFFRESGCDVTSIVPSARVLELACQKLGNKAALDIGKAEDLTFSDNEFDIVSLILSLEFASDPEKAISEAIRVCRGRVFLGVMNKYSLAATKPVNNELTDGESYQEARLFDVGTLLRLVRHHLPEADIQWGSVIFLPCPGESLVAAIDRAIPRRKNPFGAFLGMSFNVTYNLRTVQDIIVSPFQVKAPTGHPAQGVVRESQNDSDTGYGAFRIRSLPPGS